MYLETKAQKAFKVFNYVFLTLLGMITFLPFWYVLVVSLNSGGDFSRGGVYFWPRVFTLNNYRAAFTNEEIIGSLCLSVFTTGTLVVVSLVFTSLLAYALSVKTMPGGKAVTLFYYFTTIFSGGMIPYYMMLRDIGLTKSVWLYIIPFIYNFFNTVLLRTAFQDVHHELREAAQIDGAGELRILFTIYLPCARPTVATVAMFVGVTSWNDWFTGVYYQLDKTLLPIATMLQRYVGGTPNPKEMAYLMVSIVPIIIVYPFIQKYYVNGIMLGSVKG